MYMGEPIKIKFKYTGKSIDSVIDRLPTAEKEPILTEQGPAWLVDAEVYGRGALMWLLTQGTMVEVVGPPSARQEMKNMLREMLAKYEQ
ncbi:WCX domain-containing protein [Schaedlerella arabinosiphila]|jgi:predicted DNA-binding transcriptional regulator YafY